MARALAVLAAVVALAGCDWRPLAPASPHGRYAEALRAAGLDTLAAGRLWLTAADSALTTRDSIALPHDDALAFVAGRPRAWGARLALRQGERLRIRIVSALGDSSRAFVDLFETEGGVVRHVEGAAAGADTLRIERDVEADATFLLRVQPELLGAGAVRVQIETVPSLAFPVAGAGVADIGSVWADPRDGGARRHEGVDIFADRGTPAVAAAAGRITRVEETPRGGRVVWLSPDRRPVSLYYAHLDAQQVSAGERVDAGDTLGLVGTTGNAAGTPPHLHFGIYGRGGAVDPGPFVRARPAR
ncbi:MAG TPA: M23 family metallopeptidase [Rubricoccaceae bacterium]|jgi:murein DD-endopeptidase MepM/ murein hydrolase activator NlpD